MSVVEKWSVVREDPLWRAMGLLGLRRQLVAKSLLLGVLGAGSALALAALSAWLITRAWQMPPVLYLSLAVTAVRALGISRGLFRYLERLATHDVALDAMSTARRRLYVALAGGPSGYSVGLRRGELLSRTGADVDEVGNALIRALIPIGVSMVVSGAAIVIMACVSLWAAVALAGCLLVSGAVAPWGAARGARRAAVDAAVAQARSAEAMMNLLDHGPELAVTRRRAEVLSDLVSAEADARSATDRGARQSAWAATATPLAVGVSVIVAGLIGIGMADWVSPMTLGVLILLPLSAFDSTSTMTDAAMTLSRSRLAARRIMALVDRAHDYRNARPNRSTALPAGHLTVRGLRWGWPGGAVFGGSAGLDLDVKPGSRIALVGPSGCGKSTLLLTLAGLLEPVSGTVTVSSENDSDPRYFAEDGHVFTTSVRENLLVSRGDATDEVLMSALASVGLDTWVGGLPDELNTILEGGADAISGGQRRRLLVARALINTSPVLLIDEPGENLDRAEADRVQAGLLDVGGGLVDRERAVVVVSHGLPASHRADMIIDLGANSLREKAVADLSNRG
ncbi:MULTISPECIES: thiol reductant ABC exporter subunit CydC [Actinomycetes]|uniref:thiol reductant ABC exporter subunit CydC n=1 Tax=Actinomycetes TaxID=1760 RepID=UPI0004C0E9F5|nr:MULTISPECIES: thiol reductant ABC exporter subunit CydC [Actinomycetes]